MCAAPGITLAQTKYLEFIGPLPMENFRLIAQRCFTCQGGWASVLHASAGQTSLCQILQIGPRGTAPWEATGDIRKSRGKRIKEGAKCKGCTRTTSEERNTHKLTNTTTLDRED